MQAWDCAKESEEDRDCSCPHVKEGRLGVSWPRRGSSGPGSSSPAPRSRSNERAPPRDRENETSIARHFAADSPIGSAVIFASLQIDPDRVGVALLGADNRMAQRFQ